MKIKGKIALWYWLILIGTNIFLLYELIFDNDNIIVLFITLVFVNLIFLPIPCKYQISRKYERHIAPYLLPLHL